MELMLNIPEIKEEVKVGNLTLTATASLSRHVREEKLSLEETKELLAVIKGKSTREVEKILNPHAPQKLIIETDDEFLELLEKVKQLKGHVVSKPEVLLKIAMKELIQKEEKLIQKHRLKSGRITNVNM